MKQRCLFLFFVVALFYGCNRSAVLNPANRCPPYSQRILVNSSSVSKDSAWLQLPCDYNTHVGSLKKYPLLIFFNGTGETSNRGNLDKMKNLGPPKYINDSIRYEFSNGVFTHDMIVLCPQSETGYRAPISTNSIIDCMITNYRINTSRIYLTGLSSGAQSVYNYLTEKQEYANRIAAAVPMSSLKLDDAHKANLKYISNAQVKIKSFCGKRDPLYEANESYVNTINNYSPGLAIFVPYDAGHGSWNPIYEPFHTYYIHNMYEWLLHYHR